MLVKDCMTRHPIIISPETPASEAQRLMSENNVRHLPVVGSGKRLQGLITRRCLALKPDALASLNVWEISRYLSDLTCGRLMVKRPDVVTVDPDRTIERAARLMSDNKVGGLPVVDEDDSVIGIITETDLLRAFQEMLGLPQEGVRVTMRMPDRRGEFNKVTSIVAGQGWGIWGIGSFPTRRQPGFYDLVIKIEGVSPEDVRAVLGQIPDQQIVDLRETA